MYISCAECIQRLASWGDDPRVKAGRYNLCGCDFCSKPQYDRDIEQQPKPVSHEVIHRHSNMSSQDFQSLRELERQVKYLQNKLTDKAKPKHPKPAGYNGIR